MRRVTVTKSDTLRHIASLGYTCTGTSILVAGPNVKLPSEPAFIVSCFVLQTCYIEKREIEFHP